MKNFEIRRAVDGSSALQMEFDNLSTNAGHIIEFPKQRIVSTPSQRDAANEEGISALIQQNTKIFKRAGQSDMVQSLLHGSIQGRSCNRVKPWQAIVVGCSFFGIAVASLFL